MCVSSDRRKTGGVLVRGKDGPSIRGSFGGAHDVVWSARGPHSGGVWATVRASEGGFDFR